MIHPAAFQCLIVLLVKVAAIVDQMLDKKKPCELKETVKNLVDVYHVLTVEIAGIVAVVNVRTVVGVEIVGGVTVIFKNKYAQTNRNCFMNGKISNYKDKTPF
jgi:hypothetical protein